MKMKVKDQITAVVVFILGTTGYFSTGSIPAESAVFPKAIFIFTIILAVLLFVSTFFGFSLQENKEEKPNYKRVALLLISSVIYYLLINPLGYLIATPIFLVVVSYLLELRKVKTLILYPIGFSIFLYICFVVLLRVPLPMGILE